MPRKDKLNAIVNLQAMCHSGLEQKNVQENLNGGNKCKSLRIWESRQMVAPFMEIWKSGGRVGLPVNVKFEKAMRHGHPGGSWKPFQREFVNQVVNGHARIIVEVVPGIRSPKKKKNHREKKRAFRGTFRGNLILKGRRKQRKWC